MSAERVPLAGGLIDRDVATRGSVEAFERAWADPAARVLQLSGALVPVVGEPGVRTLALVAPAEVEALGAVDPDARVFVGRLEGAPVFAVSCGRENAEAAQGSGTGAAVTWAHPFEVGVELPPADRETLIIASALIRWHEAAGFSPRDGESTTVADGGWSRRDAQGGELFPRTDPAVIVLIEHENRVLLGSNALWESGRFSLLAGFVEAGETLEQAVVREVFEESGVRLGELRYVASQPWPFPRSIMLGFRARLAADQDPNALAPDPSEISELRWFTRAEVATPPAGIRLPMPFSIAGWMLRNWAAEDEG